MWVSFPSFSIAHGRIHRRQVVKCTIVQGIVNYVLPRCKEAGCEFD